MMPDEYDQSSLETVGDKPSDLSLRGTNRTASKAGSDVNSTHNSGSLSEDTDDESAGGDEKNVESNQPPKDPPMHGKGSKSEQHVDIIVKPHYGYRENLNDRVWYNFCTFEQASFSNGVWLTNRVRNKSFEGLREEVQKIRKHYDIYREYNDVSAICDTFLNSYSKAEDMPWKSDLETQIGKPICLMKELL
jgi:hypothetical protein